MKQYVITMAIRTVCLVLAFVVQPWGWHTAFFCIGAVFLPYIAVVFANQTGGRTQTSAVSPVIALESPLPEQTPEHHDDVIRVTESTRPAPQQGDAG